MWETYSSLCVFVIIQILPFVDWTCNKRWRGAWGHSWDDTEFATYRSSVEWCGSHQWDITWTDVQSFCVRQCSNVAKMDMAHDKHNIYSKFAMSMTHDYNSVSWHLVEALWSFFYSPSRFMFAALEIFKREVGMQNIWISYCNRLQLDKMNHRLFCWHYTCTVSFDHHPGKHT